MYIYLITRNFFYQIKEYAEKNLGIQIIKKF